MDKKLLQIIKAVAVVTTLCATGNATASDNTLWTCIPQDDPEIMLTACDDFCGGGLLISYIKPGGKCPKEEDVTTECPPDKCCCVCG